VPVLYARASGFDLVTRPDIQPAVQLPRRILERPEFRLDSTSGEPISAGAMIAQLARRVTAMLFE
jgi:hypothetical protein